MVKKDKDLNILENKKTPCKDKVKKDTMETEVNETNGADYKEMNYMDFLGLCEPEENVDSEHVSTDDMETSVVEIIEPKNFVNNDVSQEEIVADKVHSDDLDNKNYPKLDKAENDLESNDKNGKDLDSDDDIFEEVSKKINDSVVEKSKRKSKKASAKVKKTEKSSSNGENGKSENLVKSKNRITAFLKSEKTIKSTGGKFVELESSKADKTSKIEVDSPDEVADAGGEDGVKDSVAVLKTNDGLDCVDGVTRMELDQAGTNEVRVVSENVNQNSNDDRKNSDVKVLPTKSKRKKVNDSGSGSPDVEVIARPKRSCRNVVKIDATEEINEAEDAVIKKKSKDSKKKVENQKPPKAAESTKKNSKSEKKASEGKKVQNTIKIALKSENDSKTAKKISKSAAKSDFAKKKVQNSIKVVLKNGSKPTENLVTLKGGKLKSKNTDAKKEDKTKKSTLQVETKTVKSTKSTSKNKLDEKNSAKSTKSDFKEEKSVKLDKSGKKPTMEGKTSASTPPAAVSGKKVGLKTSMSTPPVVGSGKKSGLFNYFSSSKSVTASASCNQMISVVAEVHSPITSKRIEGIVAKSKDTPRTKESCLMSTVSPRSNVVVDDECTITWESPKKPKVNQLKTDSPQIVKTDSQRAPRKILGPSSLFGGKPPYVFAPFPDKSQSHVQQLSGFEPDAVVKSIHIKDLVEFDSLGDEKFSLKSSALASSRFKMDRLIEVPNNLDEIMEKIQSYNQSFPLKKVYEYLLSKKTKSVNENDKSLLWTEKYQPVSSAEVIGNSNNIGKLKNWLREWKERVDKEAKLARLAEKRNKSKMAEEDSNSCWSDDSDFDIGDAEDICEDALSTVLLLGPTGVGKSSVVYALAEELGFKVFEVNASSKRDGKFVLSQLQEATQSQHLAGRMSGLSSAKNPFSMALANKKPPPSAKDTKKDEKSAKKKTENKKTPRKSKKVPEKENTNSAKKDKRSNQTPKKEKKKPTSTTPSLILFDEVDVIFEDDKGFFASVETLMKSTKRPMIMTATDSSFSSQFETAVFDTINLKAPSINNIATYLQAVCLVENVFTDFEDIRGLVEVFNSDLRKLLLTLQYQLQGQFVSGQVQGQSPVSQGQPADDDNSEVKKRSRSSKRVVPVIDDDDEEDFIPKPKRRRLARDAAARSENSPAESAKKCLEKTELICGNLCYGNLGFSPYYAQKLLNLGLEDNVNFSEQVDLLLLYKSVGLNLIYENLRNLIILPTESSERSYPLVEVKEVAESSTRKSFSRIKANSLMDDDSSDDEMFFCLRPKNKDAVAKEDKESGVVAKTDSVPIEGTVAMQTDEVAMTTDEVAMNTDEVAMKTDEVAMPTDLVAMLTNEVAMQTKADVAGVDIIVEKSELVESVDVEDDATVVSENPVSKIPSKKDDKFSRDEKLAIGQILDSISKFYDCYSFVDCYIKSYSAPKSLLPGLTDEIGAQNFEKLEFNREICEISSCCNVLNLRNCRQQISTVLKSEKIDGIMTDVSIPIDSISIERPLLYSQEFTISRRKEHQIKNCVRDLTSFIPLTRDMPSISMDYVAYLRNLCKMESFRKSTKTKRRFFHYLDGLSFHIKDSTKDCLLNMLS